MRWIAHARGGRRVFALAALVLLWTREARLHWIRKACVHCGYPCRSGSTMCSECGKPLPAT